MKAFGFGFTPSGVIFVNLKSLLERKNKKLTFALSSNKRANVYLFDSLTSLSKQLKKLPDNCSVIVCDTPVLLMDQKDFEICDFVQPVGKSWMFNYKPVNYQDLLRKLLKPESGKIALENTGDYLHHTALIKSSGALPKAMQMVLSQLDPKKHKEFYKGLHSALLKNKAMDLSAETYAGIPKAYTIPLRNLLAEDQEALHELYKKLCGGKNIDANLKNTQYSRSDFLLIKKNA